MSFGSYLASVREARHMTLGALAERTKIKQHLLADLEEDDLSRWPPFLVYRYGYVRGIADALELDRDELLDRFDEAFPDFAPVAFDDGRRPARVRTRSSSAVPYRFVQRGLAVAVCLGLLAGIGFSVLDRHDAAVPVRTPVTERGANAVRDVFLEPEQEPQTAAAFGASADEQRARIVDAVARSTEGELLVASNPPNAFVTVNGIGRGLTPARVKYLPLGSYTIRVIQFGFTARESRVNLTEEQPVRTVRLALREKTSGARTGASPQRRSTQRSASTRATKASSNAPKARTTTSPAKR